MEQDDCEISSKITLNTLEKRRWRHSDILIVNFATRFHTLIEVFIVDFVQAKLVGSVLEVHLKLKYLFNPFSTYVPLLFPLKTLENSTCVPLKT